MNILFFIPSYGGGAGKVICSLANYFDHKGHSVYLASYIGIPCQYEINDNITVIDFHKPNVKKIYSELNSIRGIRKLINKKKISVIVSFTTQGNFDCLIASIGFPVPVIICERSDPFQENSLNFRIRRKIYRLAKGSVFQTKEAAEYYKSIIQNEYCIIENFVEEPKVILPDFCKRRKEIVTVTRLSNKQKRIDVLLDAFKLVANEFPDYILKIIGDGEDRGIIEQWVKEKNLEKKVILFGNSKNVINEIKYSQIFVLTSDFEGISNSMLEALSIGLPVVCTDTPTGGARAVIDNTESGIIVPCGDCGAIAEALKSLIMRPDYSEQLGKSAREKMKQYTPNAIMKKWYSYVLMIANK